MNTRYTIIAVAIALLLAGWFSFKPKSEVVVQSDLQQYSSAEYKISFSYPKNYVINEIDAPGSELRKRHIILLMRKEDLPAPEGGEGPPAISIAIYQNNLDKQTTEEWIRNSNDSNFKLGEERLSSTTISGLPALSYRWSGLYEGTTIALAQPDWIYAFTVTYFEIGDSFVQDFVAIRDSIKISK